MSEYKISIDCTKSQLVEIQLVCEKLGKTLSEYFLDFHTNAIWLKEMENKGIDPSGGFTEEERNRWEEICLEKHAREDELRRFKDCVRENNDMPADIIEKPKRGRKPKVILD